MLVLALETSGEGCGIAIADQTGVRGSGSFPHAMQLSQRLMGEVDEALRIAGVSLQDIDGFGVDIGPGSFTGVRVGVTTVKVWGRVLNKPVVGISSLDAIANGVDRKTAVPLVAMVRARPGTVYARIFSRVNGVLTAEGDPEVIEPAELATRLARKWVTDCVFCGPGVAAIREDLIQNAREAGIEATIGPEQEPCAETIALQTAASLRAGGADDPLQLAPLYIQPPNIRTKGQSTA